ncbi:hypothetical protein [Noviherbaspirillum cavernae]|uniref:hypothetical protein n=1 Tax=Noviherbaspirillum cavernae TaxID=2320862 RepID=UPI001314BE8B|nr:hypothetical protein [Noviherbaspirillum cavernae]
MQKLELEVLDAVRQMSPEARVILLRYAQALAAKYPAPQEVVLRLVSNWSNI